MRSGNLLAERLKESIGADILIEDGVIAAAVQEERFSRIKHDASFPRAAAAWCLGRAAGPVDAVVYYEKPLLKFERILATAAAVAPRGFRAFAAAMPVWLREKLFLDRHIRKGLDHAYRKRLVYVEHHESHAATMC